MDLITAPLLLRWVGALLLTLCFMLLAVYLLQSGKDKLRHNQPTRRLKRLESLGLSRTLTLHLVEADGQPYLLTADANGTHLQPLQAAPKDAAKPTITRAPK